MSSEMIKRLLRIVGVREEFRQLFFTNEFRTLAGKANRWVLLLSAILFLTLLALGFAIGGLKTLAQRMDDPFTNWVDLQIGRSVTDETIRDIRRTFADSHLRDSFLLKDLSEYVIWREQFAEQKNGTLYYRKGRTVDFDGDLIQKILGETEGNVLAGQTLAPGDSSVSLPACGLIVTLPMLEGLGYEAPLQQRKILLDYDGRPLWLEVVAVVKSLPNLCDFACSPQLFNLLTQPPDESGFINLESTSNILRFLSPEADAGKVEQWLNDKLAGGFNSLKQENFDLNNRQSHYRYDVVLNDFFDEKTRSELAARCREGAPFALKTFEEFTCNEEFQHLANPYYIAFNFSRLDRVRQFREHLQERYGIEISMDQVEAKENFALVSQLTWFMAVVLFVFGVGSIVSFIHSLLRTHLEKIKPNLGTFKAFGLGNAFLKGIYGRIVLFFLGMATVLAAGLVLLIYFFQKLFLPSGYLDVLDVRLAAACGFILLCGLLLTQWTIRRTLMDTPGNLIYGRD